jgi:hypothetical protein
MEVSGRLHAPVALPHEKPPLRFEYEAGRFWKSKNPLHLPEFEPRTVQHIASPYTDWATPTVTCK